MKIIRWKASGYQGLAFRKNKNKSDVGIWIGGLMNVSDLSLIKPHEGGQEIMNKTIYDATRCRESTKGAKNKSH